MSGGFFRGTSADQDTRFSNKQAKLMKSQKFPPELEHLVDMTKVSNDVMRPWIANRVTELLGFEDEVLINFIYGLLDGKVVNGKEVQIQLTGFMEKNTGKFMKELWTLLLSAQKNTSGVPQQFLDAKQEETRKRKEETDRLANEIQRKKDKESKELEEERLKKMDGGLEIKASNASLEPKSKHTLSKASNDRSEDDKITDKRNGVSSRNGRSSLTRSISKSRSNSRSNSSERNRSRSLSRSLKAHKRSISSERVYYSPRRGSITPRRRRFKQISLSPKRGRSRSFSLSPSPRQRRSPSPVRRRRSPSPTRRPRSPSPYRRRRSPSPSRRRRSPSPYRRRRSPSPYRRRRSPSPIRRHRSPSPMRRRRSPSLLRRNKSPSPMRRRRSPSLVSHRISPLPVRHRVSRSPARRYISPPPMRRRRSPSPLRHPRLPSLVRRYRSPSPVQRVSLSPVRGRSLSSPSPVRRRSPSLEHRLQRSPSTPQHGYVSRVGRRSPFTSDKRSTSRSKSLSPHECLLAGSRVPLLRTSPQHQRSVQSPRGRGRIRTDERLSPRALQSSSSPMSRSPPSRRSAREDKSPYKLPVGRPKEQTTRDVSYSPPRKLREQRLQHSNKESSGKEQGGDHKVKPLEKRLQNSSVTAKQKDSVSNVRYLEEFSPEIFSILGVMETRSDQKDVETRSKDQEEKRETRGVPETPDRQKSPVMYKDSLPDDRKQPSYPGEGSKSDEKNRSYSKNVKGTSRHHKSESLDTSIEHVHHSTHGGTSDSGSEEIDKHKAGDKEKRKHKRSRRREAASDDYSDDSDIEDRKEAKRRRKEEKRSRKEKKRQRRVERRQRREERQAEKKGKNQSDASASDGEDITRMESRSEDTVSEQKRLEIELRKKALESLKAKKGISH